MENVFFNYAQRYYEKNLLVTPIKPKTKAPALYAWQNPETYTDYEKLIDQFKDAEYGIGLVLGESTGIIAIDIDKEEALKLVPPSPVRKKGKKGETRFFRFNGETPKKRHDLGIELLSTGNQTILPPSTHPEGPHYHWITPDTILDFDVSDLPLLPEDFKKLLDIQNLQINVTKSDGSRCNHGSHTKLSEMLVAAILSGDTPETIVKNLLDYDSKINQEVSYFNCPSRNWKTKDKNLNAYSFVIEGYSRHVKKNIIQTVPLAAPEISINLETPKESLERRPLPHLRGMGEIMFKHLEKVSSVRRSQFFFSSVIVTTSIILGNRIRFQRNLPNLFSVIIGNSGFGKSESLKFPARLLSAAGYSSLLGDSAPTSDVGIVLNLKTQRERIDIVDEGEALFELISSKSSSGRNMASTYATLYSVSGDTYLGKTTRGAKDDKNAKGNTGGCFSPYVSLIVNTTPNGFSNLVTRSLVDSGFMARFLYFFDGEKKRGKYQKDRGIPVPEQCIDFVKMWREDTAQSGINLINDPHFAFPVKEIKFSEDVVLELERTHEIIEDIKDKESITSPIMPILERAVENIERIAQIDCALVNYKTTDLTLTPDNIIWAREAVLTIIHNTRIGLGLNLNEGPRVALIQRIMKILKDEKKLSKGELTRKLQSFPKKIRDEVLEELVEIGDVRKSIEERICYFQIK